MRKGEKLALAWLAFFVLTSLRFYSCGIGGLVELAEAGQDLLDKEQQLESPALKRRDSEELQFSWADAIKEAKQKLGIIGDA